jgi:hypothetical protein
MSDIVICKCRSQADPPWQACGCLIENKKQRNEKSQFTKTKTKQKLITEHSMIENLSNSKWGIEWNNIPKCSKQLLAQQTVQRRHVKIDSLRFVEHEIGAEEGDDHTISEQKSGSKKKTKRQIINQLQSKMDWIELHTKINPKQHGSNCECEKYAPILCVSGGCTNQFMT